MLFRILVICKAVIIFLTKLMTGRRIEDVKIDKETKQKPNKPAVDTEHKIEFQGYTASINTIVTFSFLLLGCYTVFFYLDFRPKYIQVILNYNLLTVAASFIGLYIIDNLLPRFAIKIVERLVDCQWELAWKEWKKIAS